MDSVARANGTSLESSPLAPHIFAVADAAYRAMTHPTSTVQGGANQSILVSGESGAGRSYRGRGEGGKDEGGEGREGIGGEERER